MKKLKYLSAITTVLCLFGCKESKDEPWMPVPVPGPEEYAGLMYDGGSIQNISLNTPEIIPGNENYVFENLSDMVLVVNTRKKEMPVPANLESERLVIESEIEDYYREKSGFVTDEFRRLDTPMEWNFFFTACLDGIPEITCDKVLFGEKEGTPLNKYFIVSSEANCLPGGWDAPGMLYKYGENIPTGFDEYFTGNPWLLESYAFKLVSTPPEWYREMTDRKSVV